MIVKFLMYCFILIIFLLFILIFSNIGKISTYNIRKKTDIKTYDYFRYNQWFWDNSEKLEQLYEEEYCKIMQLDFEKFALSIYLNYYRITYDKSLL